jgi:hypothetical protein
LRFLLWATVLSAPCWLLADAYHRALATATLSVLGIPAPAAAIPPPDIPASHVLGVFAAMCLASTRSPWARRLAATLIGLASLALLEWLTGVLAVAWAMRDAGHPAAPEFAGRLRDNVTSLPAWIGAPALWLALLGDRELPSGRKPRRPPSGTAPTGRR